MSLLEKLEVVLGSGTREVAESRTLPLEDAMRPIFRSFVEGALHLPWVQYIPASTHGCFWSTDQCGPRSASEPFEHALRART